jgi:hypothetical protein
MCLLINLLIYFEYFESIDPTKADDDNCPAGLRRLAARRAGRPADSQKRVKPSFATVPNLKLSRHDIHPQRCGYRP